MPVSSRSSPCGLPASSRSSIARSARSTSTWELTDTYSPAAMAMEPAARPARPAVTTVAVAVPLAATPTIRLAVDTRPSLAPSTAVPRQPPRPPPARPARTMPFDVRTDHPEKGHLIDPGFQRWRRPGNTIETDHGRP